MEDLRHMYTLLGKEASAEMVVLIEAKTLIEEFHDMFLAKLPIKLPPSWDIQRQIDWETGAMLSNRTHYRMSLGEH